jgi:hypothetical protein
MWGMLQQAVTSITKLLTAPWGSQSWRRAGLRAGFLVALQPKKAGTKAGLPARLPAPPALKCFSVVQDIPNEGNATELRERTRHAPIGLRVSYNI